MNKINKPQEITDYSTIAPGELITVITDTDQFYAHIDEFCILKDDFIETINWYFHSRVHVNKVYRGAVDAMTLCLMDEKYKDIAISLGEEAKRRIK